MTDTSRSSPESEPNLPEGWGSNWQPIETAPKDLDVVLLYEPPNAVGQGHRTLASVIGNPNDWQWVFQVTQHGCEPTHWMPLPKPPGAGAATSSKEEGK